MSCVFDSISVSITRSRLARSDEPGLGHFDDRVGQHGRFHFGRAPGELDVDVDAAAAEVRLRHTHQLSRNRAAFEILGALIRRVLRHGQHPLHAAEALLGVDQVHDRRDSVAAL